MCINLLQVECCSFLIMTEGKTRNYQLKLQQERFRLNVMIAKNWHGLLRLTAACFRATQDTHLTVMDVHSCLRTGGWIKIS